MTWKLARLLMFVIVSNSWSATVCDALNRRLELNGKEIEITGRLYGGSYTGFFLCEKQDCAPCVYRSIFSWPSQVGLHFAENWRQRAVELGRYRETVEITVRGRLYTQSDYYVINLPWRRPIGRFAYGGVAASIEVSDIIVKP